jgi:hypothetical protein
MIGTGQAQCSIRSHGIIRHGTLSLGGLFNHHVAVGTIDLLSLEVVADRDRDFYSAYLLFPRCLSSSQNARRGPAFA